MKLLRDTEKRVSIARSAIPGAGRGVFAKVSLAKGAVIEAVGTLVRAGSTEDTLTSYADIYKFRAGKYLLIPAGFAGMVNHSAKPNMEKVVKGSRVYLRALRRIEKGEELHFTYSKYAQKSFNH
jgi:SET domain-containing protein